MISDIYNSVLAIDDFEESKLQAKLTSAEKCPYHNISPDIIGPQRISIDSIRYAWQDLDSRIDAKLDAMYPDAMFFPRINWTCFCPMCAKENPTPDRHNRFGYGFSSQYSWNNALRGWNSSCIRAYKKMIKKDLAFFGNSH